MANVISVINQKGGCGKTTTSSNVAMGLWKNGYKVLAIDMDPQGHLSLGLGYRPDLLDNTVLNILESENGNYDFNEVAIEVAENLFLLPSNVSLSTFEQKYAGKAWRESRLSKALNKIQSKFDYIIIDAPPSLGLLTINSLLSSNYSIIPIDTGFYALEGVKRLQETIGMLKRHVDHNIDYKGLITFYEKKSEFAKEFEQDILKTLSGKMLNSRIRRSMKYNKTQRMGKTVIEFGSRKGGIAFHDYKDLVAEIIEWTTNDKIGMLKKATSKTVVRANMLKPVSFRMKDDVKARDVFIAGEFNDWAPIPLNKRNGSWEKSLNLKPGKYDYKYIINGNWVLDPGNDIVNEKNGILNSVLEVK